MWKMIHKYVRTCEKCQTMNLQKLNYISLHQDIGQTPQDHSSIDLMAPYNTTTQGDIYTITAICNLTGCLMTTPIPDKRTSTVAIHFFADIMLKFGFPRILDSDNGTEFKSKLIEHLVQQHGIKKTYISPCHTHSKKIELSHQFLNDCICKFLIDSYSRMGPATSIPPYTTTAFNRFPNKNSQQYPQFPVFWVQPPLT